MTAKLVAHAIVSRVLMTLAYPLTGAGLSLSTADRIRQLGPRQAAGGAGTGRRCTHPRYSARGGTRPPGGGPGGLALVDHRHADLPWDLGDRGAPEFGIRSGSACYDER